MDPTTLSGLVAEGGVELAPGGLLVQTKAQWIVPGEDHLSYTTLTRLAECCREHHWASDILPAAAGTPIDAIARAFQATFSTPVLAGARIWIGYRPELARSRQYDLIIEVFDEFRSRLHARFTINCVFYDPVRHKAIIAPEPVRKRLEELASSSAERTERSHAAETA